MTRQAFLRFFSLSGFAWAGWLAITAQAAENYRVVVAASDVDRAGQIATFSLPAGFGPDVELRDHENHDVALQVEADRSARFIVSAQKAGEAALFSLVSGSAPALNRGVQVIEEPSPKNSGKLAELKASDGVNRLLPKPGRLRLSINGAPVFYYQMDPEALPRPDIDPHYKRAGYLHPILSPAGKVVSDDYPPQQLQQHGVWSSWAKTRFQGRTPNFENAGEKTGTIECVELDRTWSGPVTGGFSAWHRFVDLSAAAPVVALNETWQLTAYNLSSVTRSGGEARPLRMFDLVITQTCATSDPLFLPADQSGGLGLRGRSETSGATKTIFLTSNGETDRSKANAERVRWCYLGDEGESGIAGIAVLGHPSNFRAPQPVVVGANEPDFAFAPSVLGDWSIEPGQPFVARYRLIVTDGTPDKTLLDACWNGYATNAVVTVEAQK